MARPLGVLVFTVPYVALAVVASRAGFISSTHQEFVSVAQHVRNLGRVPAISFSYPPIPRLLAVIIPNAAALSVLAAFAAGSAIWFVWRRLFQAGVPWWLRLAIVAAIGATPGYGFLMTQSLPRATAILFIAIAIDGFLAFTVKGETAGGFRCGLLLGIAFFVDFNAVFVALGLALAAVPFVRTRLRGAGLTRATIAVVVFPAVAAAGAWAYAEWVQTGNAFAALGDRRLPLAWFPDAAKAFTGVAALRTTGLEMACAPVFLVACVLLARRVRGHALALLVAPLALILIRLVGVAYVPTSYVLLSLIGAVAVPAVLRGGERTLLLAAAVVQLAVGWTVADITTEGERWRHAIGGWLHV